MRIRHMVASSALGAALAFSASSQAVSTLRVGHQVLSAGDSDMRVTELLGKPANKSRSRGSRGDGFRSRGRSRHVRVLSDEARGEKWRYRRDDHVTTVTIVDGKVTDIDDRRI